MLLRFSQKKSWAAWVLNSIWVLAFLTVSSFLWIGSVVMLMQLASVASLLMGIGLLMMSLIMLFWLVHFTWKRVQAWSNYKGNAEFPEVEYDYAQHEVGAIPGTGRWQGMFWLWWTVSCAFMVTGCILGVSPIHSMWMVQVLTAVFGTASVNPLWVLLTLAVGAICVDYVLVIKTSLLYEDRKIQTDEVKQHPVAFVLKQLSQALFITLSIGYGIYGVCATLSVISMATVGMLLAYLSVGLAGIGFVLYSMKTPMQGEHRETWAKKSLFVMGLAIISGAAAFMNAALFSTVLWIALPIALLVSIVSCVVYWRACSILNYWLSQNETAYRPLFSHHLDDLDLLNKEPCSINKRQLNQQHELGQSNSEAKGTVFYNNGELIYVKSEYCNDNIIEVHELSIGSISFVIAGPEGVRDSLYSEIIYASLQEVGIRTREDDHHGKIRYFCQSFGQERNDQDITDLLENKQKRSPIGTPRGPP